jgi:hypothetical protein
MTTTVKSVHAWEILDSRGNSTTVEVEISLAGAAYGWAAVPSGASTGVHEARIHSPVIPASTAKRSFDSGLTSIFPDTQRRYQ